MVNRSWLGVLLWLVMLGTGASAGELTVDALLVSAEDLPEGYRLVDGFHCVSMQPRTFYDMPAMKDFLPTPRRKAAQSLAAPGRDPGSILLLEYEKPFPRELRDGFLQGYLYGESGSQSRLHPEEVITFDRFLLILSFPRGDPAAEWFKARLRNRHKIPATRHRVDVIPVMREVMKAYDAQDAAAGLKLLDDNAKALADVSFAWFIRGEFGVMKGDFALAESGYGRAMELHDSLVDPLSSDPDGTWACLDGWGISFIAQAKYEECVKVLTRAAEAGKTLEARQTAQTHYNLACALSQLERFDEAYRHLVKAIEGKPSYKESALRDSDLVGALKRREFRELLK